MDWEHIPCDVWIEADGVENAEATPMIVDARSGSFIFSLNLYYTLKGLRRLFRLVVR